MRGRTIKDANLRLIISLTLLAFCAGGFVFNAERCTEVIGKLALMSASTVLPTGADFGIGGDMSETLPDVTGDMQVSTTEDTTQAATTANAETDGDDGLQFSSTPDDIRQMMLKYEKTAGKDKKGGKISEQTYKSSGVTDSFGRVRVKNVNDTGINIKKLLGEKADLDIKDKSKPTVLIFHTHTTETYQPLDRNFYSKNYQPRTNDSSMNMVRVGVAVKE